MEELSCGINGAKGSFRLIVQRSRSLTAHAITNLLKEGKVAQLYNRMDSWNAKENSQGLNLNQALINHLFTP